MADDKVLQEMRENILSIKATVDKMAAMNDLKLIALEEKLKVANNRIKDLEDNNKWLWRAVAGAIISCAIALLFKR